MLTDKDASVRVTTLQALLLIYEDEGAHQDLEMFTAHLMERLKFRAQDINESVATLVVQLMTNFAKAGKLGAPDIELFHELIFADSRPVRQAAGAFVQHTLMVEEFGGLWERVVAENLPLKREVLAIKHLVQFCGQAGQEFIETRALLVVDALSGVCPELRDWPHMLQLLQQTNCLDEDAEEQALDDMTLTPSEETLLLEIFYYSAQLATTGYLPELGKEPKLTAPQKKAKDAALASFSQARAKRSRKKERACVDSPVLASLLFFFFFFLVRPCTRRCRI